jgi:hypothetical protein
MAFSASSSRHGTRHGHWQHQQAGGQLTISQAIMTLYFFDDWCAVHDSFFLVVIDRNHAPQ